MSENLERLRNMAVGSLLIALAVFIISLVAGEKKINRYYVSGTDKGALVIKLDIDNFEDPTIYPNGQSFERILILVDSLNLTLKK